MTNPPAPNLLTHFYFNLSASCWSHLEPSSHRCASPLRTVAPLSHSDHHGTFPLFIPPPRRIPLLLITSLDPVTMRYKGGVSGLVVNASKWLHAVLSYCGHTFNIKHFVRNWDKILFVVVINFVLCSYTFV